MENPVYKYFMSLTEHQKTLIDNLLPLYTEWNAKINVISRADMGEFYLHHVLHSLAIAKCIKALGLEGMFLRGGLTVLDAGCGGGFPGIPLSILYPDVQFVLADSIGKKIKVVRSVAEALGLKNVTAVNSRIEEIKTKQLIGAQSFNFVVSRAVTHLEKFLPWVKERYSDGLFYLKGGSMAEGGELRQEIASAAATNRLEPGNIAVYDIERWFSEPFFEEKRVLFVINS